MEIERKFLVNDLPFRLEDYPCRHLAQGYISRDPVIRVRRCETERGTDAATGCKVVSSGTECRQADETAVSYELTCKGRGLMAREEINLPLEREAYDRLKAKVEGRVVVKTRYLIPLEEAQTPADGDAPGSPDDSAKLVCELDVFEGELAPLMLAEVEFGSEEEARAFKPPAWMGIEVTGDPAYQNVNMSLNGRP